MSNQYTYDPNAWPPSLAGVVAGAIGAIVAAIVGWMLTGGVVDRPSEYANSLTVVLISLTLGWISGLLWRRLRVSDNAVKTFSWTIAGAFLVALSAVLIVDQTVLSSLAPYAIPLAAIVFITLGFFTPALARVTAPLWAAAIPLLLAFAVGVGLFL